ncbi:hypothetical protein NQ314_006577 [Rhamnusium bicolor]|uniref:PiggyBac transposable element-derived protein domain-containing protein n=1 Tax=Rhamnusium bicolor TaxID=1586634 RepID=A0AAV8YZP8_9CUCU|nr:hypothetical protein NQ314_006577 [Rhamnusium bicolor]
MYTGPDNFFTKLKEDEPYLKVTGNVVRLIRIVPKNLNYCIYFDNFYASVPLMVHLVSQGMYSLGTVKRNRIPHNKLLEEKEMKKLDRGTSEEYVANVDGVDLSAVAWKDNKTVSLLSTAYGELPLHKVTRYDRKQKKNISINCPNVIIQYNKHIRGVDLLDSHIGRYKIPLRSKKWYMRIFFHLLDVSIKNAWLLYNRIQKKENCDKKNVWEFRLEITQCLCLMGPRNEKIRGKAIK